MFRIYPNLTHWCYVRYCAYCGSFNISCCTNIFIWRVLHFCSCCCWCFYIIWLKWIFCWSGNLYWCAIFSCSEIFDDKSTDVYKLNSFCFPMYEEITWSGDITEMTSNDIQNFFLSGRSTQSVDLRIFFFKGFYVMYCIVLPTIKSDSEVNSALVSQ